MKTQYVPIPDVLWFQEGPGVRNTQYTASGVKLLNVANLVDGNVDLSTSDRYISEDEAYGKYKHFLVDSGDFIIASSGIKVEYFDKKMGFVHDWQLPLCMNTSTIRFKSLDSDALNIRYFMYYLKSDQFKEHLSKQITGSAQLNFGPSHLKKMYIPLASIDSQLDAVRCLDKLYEIESAYKVQLTKLDDLVKSRFIELFGDASQFASIPLENSVEEMFIGPFGSSLKNECFVAAEDGYCMVYEQKHAIRKTMDVETRYVDEAKYKELRRFSVMGGDIIVSCRGTIGETYIVPEDAPLGIMHPSIMKIRLKDATYNKIFFNHLLQSVLKKHESEANGSGIKMAITATALGKEAFIVPALDLQNEFAAFVEQTDKLKLVAKTSLQHLQTLKSSLMQQYFG